MGFPSRPSSSRSSSGGRGRGGREGVPGDAPRDRAPLPAGDPLEVARQICLHQLEHAPRTRAELAAVLRRKGVEDDVAASVLGRFTEVGMIDDALFARMWVTSRHRGRGLAGRALSHELRRKGVDDASIAEAVGTLDRETEEATARALVDRRLRTTSGLAADARMRRLAGMLARKGYPAGLAFRVVKEALAAEGEQTDEALAGLEALEALDEPYGGCEPHGG